MTSRSCCRNRVVGMFDGLVVDDGQLAVVLYDSRTLYITVQREIEKSTRLKHTREVERERVVDPVIGAF